MSGALDVMGRLAAAAVLLKMLDSSKDRRQERVAEMHLGHALHRMREQQEQQEELPFRRGFSTGPRLFAASQGPAQLEPEDMMLRHQSGILSNVPYGLDSGMVRLAHDLGEEAGRKLAAQAPTGWLSGTAAKVTAAAKSAPKRLSNALNGPAMPKPPTVKPLQSTGGFANPELQVSKTDAWIDKRNAAAKSLEGAPPAANVMTPAAEAQSNSAAYRKRMEQQAVTVPRAQGAQGAKAPPGSPNTPPPPVSSPGRILAGTAVGGLGALALTKGTDKATELLSEEAPPTPWGLQRYGAPTLAQGVNIYGQTHYGS